MGTVFGASLSPLEKEADLICMESEMMDYKIKSIQDIVSGQYERALMECEYITLKNGGTYDEYTDMVLEAAAENTQKQAGIIRTILNAIGQQISRFGDFIQRALGTNNSRLKDVPDDATGTVDGKSATIIDKLMQVGPNLFKQIKEKIAEIEDAIKTHKVISAATISLAAVGLGVLVKGSKENQEAENAPEKTINKPTFLEYMNKWAEFQDEFKEINDHGNKVLNMLLAPVDAVKARAEHIAGEKNAKREAEEQEEEQSESADMSDVSGEPVMESESNYGLSAYDGLFMESSVSDLEAAISKKDTKKALSILNDLSAHARISERDADDYAARIRKLINNPNSTAAASDKPVKNPKVTIPASGTTATGGTKTGTKGTTTGTKTTTGKGKGKKTNEPSIPIQSANSRTDADYGNAKPAGSEEVMGRKVRDASARRNVANNVKNTEQMSTGYQAQVGNQMPKDAPKPEEKKPTLKDKVKGTVNKVKELASDPKENQDQNANQNDQQSQSTEGLLSGNNADPKAGNADKTTQAPTKAMSTQGKRKLGQQIADLNQLKEDDPAEAKTQGESILKNLRTFNNTTEEQQTVQGIIDAATKAVDDKEKEGKESEFSKLPWYDKAVTFLKSLLDVTAAVIGATGSSMVNAVKGFVSWVKDNTAKATGKGDDENGEQPAQQEGQGESEAKPENASAPIDNVEGDTMTESPDLFGIGDEYKEMTEGPSMDELSAFEAAIVNL